MKVMDRNQAIFLNFFYFNLNLRFCFETEYFIKSRTLLEGLWMKFVEISWCIVYIQIADWTRFDDP